MSLKIAAVEYVKQFTTPVGVNKKTDVQKVRIEPNERKAPVYNPEDDEVYDFDEADVVDEDDLVDLDDLEDVKLDIELGVQKKQTKRKWHELCQYVHIDRKLDQFHLLWVKLTLTENSINENTRSHIQDN